MLSNSNSDFLPPIQDNDFLPSISHWTTLGGLFIICVVGLAIPLASVAKYKETVNDFCNTTSSRGQLPSWGAWYQLKFKQLPAHALTTTNYGICD